MYLYLTVNFIISTTFVFKQFVRLKTIFVHNYTANVLIIQFQNVIALSEHYIMCVRV